MLSAAPKLAQVLSNHGVGGSEIAAACGLSKYKSPYGLWLQKTGREPPFAGNVHTRLGQLLEPRARQLYANDTGITVETPGESMFHPEFDWHRATPDGWNHEDRLHGVQFKCVGYFVGKRFKFEIPIEYLAQCQWEMHVAGFNRVDLAVLSGSDELEWERFLFGEAVDPREIFEKATLDIYPIYRSDYEIDLLRKGCDAFWNMVVTDTAPAVDHSPECMKHLGQKAGGNVTIQYLDNNGEVMDELTAAVVDEWESADDEFDKAEKRLATAKNAVRARMGELGANRITTPGGPVIWTKRKDGSTQLRQPPGWSKDPT